MKWETWIFGQTRHLLILLFFVILFLLGMMSIVTYFVRTSGISKNASESEKRTYGRLYPVIVLMNLFLMLMFAYMVFCSVTCRALGKWFLPVSLILTFSPFIWYIYKSRKETTPKKSWKRQYAKQEKEQAEEAVSYRTRIDSLAGGIDSDTGSDRGKNRNRQCDGREAKLAGHRNFWVWYCLYLFLLFLCGIPSIMITYLCSAIFLERNGFHMRALPI